tara:strand:- start:149 stop:433 length:285 start_codon:yes stop_codon:yes gene_type:complete
MGTRNSNGQFKKGVSGNPNGRPKRADEQFLLDLWEEEGKKQFSEAVRQGDRWALKVLVDKLYPSPKRSNPTIPVEHTPILVKFDSAFKKITDKK